ncbi:DNA methyltransferase [Candidatus Magnetominusculus xianensis]|uniref:site-specific DNA-methyltransferase (adenine-specific) n=1 Tax=Candidatus Magnetominusculus xianensis TaxID=1748249 RepID=A0ABR5SEF9_9BACT|nr:site-specific DNA-methyltransferase [Candidatus Magnetominusculus xianensis]KWT84412.1 DNA methylase [Candidatus Magnetominusculus xianensis]MBF0404246.1 site-specific DNA-methyltransferase [Nitrospirota bacterium]
MQNLLQDLVKLLEQDDRLVVEGQLLKNKIVELALGMDAGLIRLLLTHEGIRRHFFTSIDDILVFDKIKFQQFVSNKEFLPDSYTAFKNKIGLTVDTRYLTDSGEVVLAWPYKDCVLEGGQTKEDARRNEIFWNETLAPDEIDRLLSPKVLTGFKRCDKDGQHSVTSISREDNLIIKGNNLIALHTLAKTYAGKVKLIYIDPPYNLGTDSFKYNDSFNHSTWLTFMQNRLEIAKTLLMSNGIVFIHIGDTEMHYLKLLADAVFGREHFIATVPRKTRSGKSDVPYKLSQDYDWMLVYTKNARPNEDLFHRKVSRKYYKTPDFPDDEWRLSDLTTQRTVTERPNSNFTLINPRTGDEFFVNQNRCWGITRDSIDEYITKQRIVFPGDYDFLDIAQPALRVFKSDEIQKNGDDYDKAYVSTEFLNLISNDLLKKTTNKKGTDEIVGLFGDKAFSYPKNELLLHKIIEYTTKAGDIVLDFFIGSGTTAAVAHKMGRRYVGVEQMDYINTITVERMKKVMAGEQGGISKTVGWHGGGSFIYCELARANQVFVDRIQSAKDVQELQSIYMEMQDKAFLSYRIDPKKIDQTISDFRALSFKDQQRFLIEVLDKNMLYVPLSEIDDDTYGISDEDKKLNRQFFDLR